MQPRIKKSLICKNVNNFKIDERLKTTHLPKAGEVALFRVKELGKHTKIQNDDGKNRYIFPGDLVLLAFGNRYATNQLEGYVPDRVLDEYHVLGQGGVAGHVKSMYKTLELLGPTTMDLIGFAVDENGDVVNTKVPLLKLSQAAGSQNGLKKRCKVILSLGTSMDSGKTTTAGYLCRGLSMAGEKTAYMKLTGTIYGKDPGFAYDCGADTVVDFSHFGYPSTYLSTEEELVVLFEAMMNKLYANQSDFVVVEIADGLLQRETKMLLNSDRFMKKVHSVIFSAGDSLGVLSSLELLKQWGIRPFAVSGCFTMSPLLVEEVREHCHTEILTLEDLEASSIIRFFEPKLKCVPKLKVNVA